MIQKKKKIYKNPTMFVKCTNKEIVFRNLKDGQTW